MMCTSPSRRGNCYKSNAGFLTAASLLCTELLAYVPSAYAKWVGVNPDVVTSPPWALSCVSFYWKCSGPFMLVSSGGKHTDSMSGQYREQYGDVAPRRQLHRGDNFVS